MLDLIEKIIWLILIISLVSFFSLGSVFAEDRIETLSMEHRDTPTVCIMEPSPNIQDRFHSGIFNMTYESVNKWSSDMIDYTGGDWYMPIQYHEYETHFDKTPEDFPGCNIFIEYRQYNGVDGKPHKSNTALGYTAFNHSKSWHQYSYVMVFFEIPQENPKISLCIGCDKDPTISVEVKHVELPDLTINRVIMHEFGHALGIGHYIEDNNKSNNVESLMYPTLNPFSELSIDISEVDKEMLVKLYYKDGFSGAYGISPYYFEVSELIP